MPLTRHCGPKCMNRTFDEDTHYDVWVGFTFSKHPDYVGQCPNTLRDTGRSLLCQLCELIDFRLLLVNFRMISSRFLDLTLCSQHCISGSQHVQRFDRGLTARIQCHATIFNGSSAKLLRCQFRGKRCSGALLQ